jgi:hypothetical protein
MTRGAGTFACRVGTRADARISQTNPFSPAPPTAPTKTFQNICVNSNTRKKWALFGFVIGFGQPSASTKNLQKPLK